MRLFLGQRAWVLQRASALVLLLFVVVASLRLLLGAPIGYSDWRAIADSGRGATLIVLCFGALCLHAWIGTRDIVLDYVKPLGARFVVLGIVALTLIAVLASILLTLAGHLAGA